MMMALKRWTRKDWVMDKVAITLVLVVAITFAVVARYYKYIYDQKIEITVSGYEAQDVIDARKTAGEFLDCWIGEDRDTDCLPDYLDSETPFRNCIETEFYGVNPPDDANDYLDTIFLGELLGQGMEITDRLSLVNRDRLESHGFAIFTLAPGQLRELEEEFNENLSEEEASVMLVDEKVIQIIAAIRWEEAKTNTVDLYLIKRENGWFLYDWRVIEF
jgi:hypothetical protein